MTVDTWDKINWVWENNPSEVCNNCPELVVMSEPYEFWGMKGTCVVSECRLVNDQLEPHCQRAVPLELRCPGLSLVPSPIPGGDEDDEV